MNLENLNLSELETQEMTQLNGGSEVSDAIMYGLGYFARCCVIFATEGGNNAGVCVR